MLNNQPQGSIEVICGSMFSGKTEELIRRIKRVKLANQSVLVFKHELDSRYDNSKVVSHNQTYQEAIPVKSSIAILNYIKQYGLENVVEVIAIDEAQFFDRVIVPVVSDLSDLGKRIIIAGLDLDSNRKPFGAMGDLLSLAEEVTKLHAICVKCGKLATYTYYTPNNYKDTIKVGTADLYEARCRECYLLGIQEF